MTVDRRTDATSSIDEVAEPEFDLSPRTGQPRRTGWVAVPMFFLYAASIAAAVVGAIVWWRSIQIGRFHEASRLAGWVNMPPYVWQSVVTACAVVLIAVILVAAPAVAAYNAWCGHGWSRLAAWVAVATSGLGFLLNNWIAVSTGLATIGALGLLLPGARRFFEQWRRFGHGPNTVEDEACDVFYGPVPSLS